MTSRRAALFATCVALAACGELLATKDDGAPAPSSDDPGGEPDGAPSDDATTVPVGSEDAGADAPVADAGRRGRIVFVTRATPLGGFGGLVGGDAICQAEALDAGVGGVFVAWLSTSGAVVVDARSRLSGDAGWSLVDGGEVFARPSSIAAGSYPETGITRTAWGETVTGTVWTATRETGERYDGADCVAWTDVNAGGVVGVVGATDGTWTSSATDYCNVPRRLLCFEK